MLRSLVGSEMCIRDRYQRRVRGPPTEVTMAKGKDMSKKAKAASKDKMLVDKTFGMKNKNKSKKVQKYVHSVQCAAENRFVDRKAEKEKTKAQSRKDAKKAHEAEIAALFQVVGEDPSKKKKKKKEEEEAAPPEEESVDDTAAFLEQLGIEIPKPDGRRKLAKARRDANANAKEEERLRRIAEKDGKSIEERLEVVRQSLKLEAPVTKETFAEWKEQRDIRLREEKEAAVKKAKKGTKHGGKSMLTGRQLFEFHEDLFVDDADAGDSEAYTREFEDAEQATAAAQGEDAGAAPEGAAPDGAAAEDAAEPAKNDTAVAPSLEGVDQSVFLAEDLDGLDDLPSSDEDED
eukprot:TRINITY_DN3725_c0_g11_i1.p1 TRINITY_DN3725_c0_g11~~TRINITY_DN3725_c0_g11_i1.p1  ORF type:complete len:394 (+),score=154.03 TRINITY_DN3725_c0_g11_i1:142-1182(+)